MSSYNVIKQQQKDSGFYYFKKGIKLDNLNKHHLAYNYYLKARAFYKNKNDLDSVAECNFQVYTLLNSQKNLGLDPQVYFIDFINYVNNSTDTIKQIKSYKEYAIKLLKKSQYSNSLEFYRRIIFLSKRIKNREIEANTYSNLGLLYTNYKKDSASYFFEKALKIYDNSLTTEIFSTYLNYGNLYQKEGDFDNAIKKFKKAEKINPEKYALNLKRILFFKLAQSHQKINDYKTAYFYFDKYDLIRDSINNTQQNIAISDIKEKYDNEKLRANNLEIESKRKQSQNLLYGSLAFLFLSGTIGFLTLKNSRKKRLLAEQQNELEKQKNLTLLKEQEINTINAMVDGQEKERIRIAEDLHDNIGSVLATLKLHFENLKLNREKKHFDQDELYAKTENLIDETYLKVRSIAHAKNAGVIANKGLLVAVKLMAEKISDANKITIHVLDFGLDKRLENKLEITLFRIIQELITNIIKHANASEATINIALYDQNLNIIIEDNGKGFKYDKTTLKEGIGLSSIKTRIMHLKGTFNIDSTLGKGTSIIINIPIT
ncbi:ATP-binding protein [uncultured Tenacibaculum sp.]|uniref:tetratricopeptide repeat-containing sensor histidine kinase n=1 Tax=uncultured Tenacibaculum sp. TaxID=174713 RepID=UPI00260B08F0|nr:ATP-binding protein [uncultured Tenacibaculum sp.]